MIENKYLDFDKIGDTGKTEIWNVLPRSSDFILGQIKWCWPWRQYCFFPSPNCVFNNTYMSDIQKMMKELMDRKKK